MSGSPPASPGGSRRRTDKGGAAAVATAAMAASKAAAAAPKKDTKPAPVAAKDAKPKTKKELEAERLAQEEAEKYKAPTVGSGRFEFPNGAVYEGEWQDFGGEKKRHGYGRFTNGGEQYDGSWSEGHIQGRGKYTFASGAYYDGEWLADKFQGRGTYVWPAQGAQGSSSYIGDWAQNKMHGVGAFLASTGDRYQGVFQNDRFLNAQGHWIAPTQAVTQQPKQ